LRRHLAWRLRRRPRRQRRGSPLAPLWDDLESALAELDSALAGIEGWEVAVP